MITAIEKLSQAERWLAEAKSLDELKQIHDIAIAADAYAKAHRLGLQAENHAMEIRLLAARRIGELCPPEQGKRTDLKTSPNFGEVEHQRLSEFRKLAEIPEAEFKTRVNSLKDREEKITYNRILAGSHSVLSSEDYEWWTPEKYIKSVHAVLGEIDLDPASCKEANKIVQAKKFYTLENDGLDPVNEWSGRIFLNPPYGSDGPPFITRLVTELKQKVVEAICLVNSRATDAEWFQPLFDGTICFTNHRIDFDSPSQKLTTSTHGSCFVYFGNDQRRFAEIFSVYGNILKRWPNA